MLHNLEGAALSHRQSEIAALVVAGKSNREIAEKLFLSPRTVETHIAAIFAKYGVRSRVEIVSAHAASLPERGRVPTEREPAERGNLPRRLTTFVGRDAEIGALLSLLNRHRLVTIVGSGGVGKTRTSLEVGRVLDESAPDGVWLVELGVLADGNYLLQTVAQTLGIVLPIDGDGPRSFVRQLRAKRAILIFDNCEHVVHAAGLLIASILRECENVTILATSRQPLGIDGEITYRFPALEIPSAVALFVDRARAVDNRFEISAADADAMREICRRLDGVPLTIELAAARTTMLTPQQLLARLDDVLRMLSGGSRDVLPRHQTLRAMIDWSYDLLDEDERRVFRRASIFAATFTLEAGLAVASEKGENDLDTFDLFASLIDKSLLTVEREADGIAYRFLESTRAYAFEKLIASGECDELARRHLEYLCERFSEAGRHFARTGGTHEIATVFASELDDVRAALDAALVRGDVRRGGQLLASIGQCWLPLGLDREGRTRIEAYLATIDGKEHYLRAHLLLPLANMLFSSGRKRLAWQYARRALECARASGDAATLLSALVGSAKAALGLNLLDEAELPLSEAEAARDVPLGTAVALRRFRAWILMSRGDFAASEAMLTQLMEQQLSRGDVAGELLTRVYLAYSTYMSGSIAEAIVMANKTLALIRPTGNVHLLGIMQMDLAAFLCAADDLHGAAHAAFEAIGKFISIETESSNVAMAIEILGLVCALRGDYTRAAMLAGFADAAVERNGFERDAASLRTHRRLTALIEESFSPRDLERLRNEGARFSPEAAASFAKP